MTLPNRTGYQVQDKRPVYASPPQTNVNNPPSNVNITPTHDFSKNHFGTPIQTPSLNEAHFPFPSHGEFSHGIDNRGLINYLPENELHQELQNQQTIAQANLFNNRIPNPHPQDNLTAEELNERKNFVRTHRLLPVFMELLTTCKKENIIPEPQVNQDGLPWTDDFGLDDFLESQGIDTSPLHSDDSSKNSQREEFLFKLNQLQFKYKEEIEKLNKVCNECCSQLIMTLREQSTIRPVGEHEAQVKLQKVKHKFDYAKNQLRVCVCSAISALQKQYNQVRKKHKSLPKKATQSLSQWFFEHIQNPYPTEQEKAMLAAAGGLTLTQVNNWFGNKRIRYKRKCLENEAKRIHESGDLGHMESLSSPSPPTLSGITALPTGLTNSAPMERRKSTGSRPQKKSKLMLDDEKSDDDDYFDDDDDE